MIFDNTKKATTMLLTKIDEKCPVCDAPIIPEHLYRHGQTLECPLCHLRIRIGTRNNDRIDNFTVVSILCFMAGAVLMVLLSL